MLAQSSPYIGRTCNSRVTSPNKLSGILPRWSEHVRELQRRLSQTVPTNRTRRRYIELRHGIRTSCLNVVIYDACWTNEIACREAVAITVVQPRANGNEPKHFSEQFRPSRARPPKKRARLNGSSRRKARKASLRKQAEQWGEDFPVLGRSLRQLRSPI